MKKLTPAQVKALTILQEYGPLMPHEFAKWMWPDSPCWQRCYKCGPHGASDGIMMAVVGGGYLGKLRKLGLVVSDLDRWISPERGATCHAISTEGERRLREWMEDAKP